MASKSRLAALALCVGGLSALVVTTLELSAWNQADESILGLTGEDYSRWSVFPLMLILCGLVGLHRHQANTYDRLGRIGFSATFMGYSMLLVGETFSEVLFPHNHPLYTLGGTLSWLALPTIIAGLGIWGIASIRSRSLPIWAAPAPLAMSLVWVLGRFYISDVLYISFAVRDVILTQGVNAVGFGLLGLALWRSDDVAAPSSRTSGVLSRT